MLDLSINHAILLAVIIGVVELISRVRAKDWWAVATIVSSAIVGAIFGATKYYGDLDIASGIAAGMAASGLVTLISVKRSSAHPSNVIDGR
jgi:uncharacterized membrane protein HdeD (DUF308 family)